MIITGGMYKGRKILSPDERITRPTLSKVRQGVFNTLFSMIGNFEEKTFLDLFGGSGVMGLEAISRGFKDVVVFEKNPKVGQIIKKNYEKLNLKPTLWIGDCLKMIEKFGTNCDVIYVDPPYYSGVYEEVLELLKNSINQDAIIVVEHVEDIDIKDLILIKQKNYGDKLVSFLSK